MGGWGAVQFPKYIVGENCKNRKRKDCPTWDKYKRYIEIGNIYRIGNIWLSSYKYNSIGNTHISQLSPPRKIYIEQEGHKCTHYCQKCQKIEKN